jgi:integrase
LLDIPELLAVVEQWDHQARAQLPPEAMWYTPIIVRWDAVTLSPARAGAGRLVAIGKRLRRLFALAGLQPKSPHKFRHGHAVCALQHAQTMADYKAVSMNLMHEDVQITDSIYAPLLGSEVRDRISRLAAGAGGSPIHEIELVQYVRGLSEGQMSKALHILADELTR